MKPHLSTLFCLIAAPAAALTPLPPCNVEIEADMTVYDVQRLGDSDTAGVTVEDYANATTLTDTVYEPRPGPVPALNGFSGARVTFCATGDFVAIPGQNASTVNSSLSATEFLRGKLQKAQPVRFADLRRAAKAVYGDVIVLRESDETCACSAFYPDLRPAGMTAYADRTDVDR